MTISNFSHADHAFVWIWLPGKTMPIVAGKITKDNNVYTYDY